jgi:adenylyl- and sulfurtransferase ThiI
MKEWNVILTSQMGEERRLLYEMTDYGEFSLSGFRAVILGKVPELKEFFEALKRRWETQPFFPEILSSATPVQILFPFALEGLMERLKQEVLPFLPAIAGKPFYVRVKRRGHKGAISSQEVEQALDRFLLDELATQGLQSRIDFTRAEIILLVELLHNRGGLALITREMQARYPFIKVK